MQIKLKISLIHSDNKSIEYQLNYFILTVLHINYSFSYRLFIKNMLLSLLKLINSMINIQTFTIFNGLVNVSKNLE